MLFVIGPLILAGRGQARPRGWLAWLVYFGALGAGFMLIEVSVLQRFVLLLGHPVYSLTVTLFSLLLGTGLGAAWSRRFDGASLRRSGAIGLLTVAVVALAFIVVATPIVNWAIPFSRGARMLIAVAMLVPIGVALGIPMPTGLRMLSARAPQMLAWAWGINGALSVLGATLAIFIAMNWGFRVTLMTASGTYLIGLAALLAATRASISELKARTSRVRPRGQPSDVWPTELPASQPHNAQLFNSLRPLERRTTFQRLTMLNW